MSLTGGEVFAGYVIQRLLGAGGMGEVYLAGHPRLPRSDAVKVLRAELSEDADYRQRFHREADLAATLWHPHIVGVVDRGEFNGRLWIAMDYVNGTDAARLLTDHYRGGMPEAEVREIVTAVADALDFAHRRRLLHRDVKPANILLTAPDADERRILLADFGIARQTDDVSGLTATNMTVGSVAYAAPEQLLGEDIDGRADQYALAATAFALFTGAPPFPQSNPAVVIGKHLNAPAPSLAQHRPDLAHLDTALATALAKDPTQRYPHCLDFARALGQPATQSPTRYLTTPAAPTPLVHRPVVESLYYRAVAEYREDELQIDAGVPLGEGGAAVIRRCVTPDGRSMAFKRYNNETREKLDAAALRDLAALPAGLTPEDRDRLLATCAWPLGIVNEADSAIGVLMVEAPTEFFLERNGVRTPRHLTRIAVPEAIAHKRGYEYFDFPHKIARLGYLMADMEFLHSNYIVVGDLQPNNILTTGVRAIGGVVSTRNYMLDCDSFIFHGRAALPHLDPLPWKPPYKTDGFSATTDMYKFALLMMRCLREDLSAAWIDFDKFGEVLPRADLNKLEMLLSSPEPDLTSGDLVALAHAWQAVVRADGRMFRATDTTIRERWQESMRQKHLAALAPATTHGDTGTSKPASGTQTSGQQSDTNRLAIASVATSIVGICGITAVVGIVLGLVALNQIKHTRQGGRRLALAGIWIGVAWIIFLVVAMAAGG